MARFFFHIVSPFRVSFSKGVTDLLMAYIWLGIAAFSIIFSAATGSAAAVSAAVFDGAKAAVELCISIAGPICLWSAVIEVMNESGISNLLSRFLSPFLRFVFPSSFADRECSEALSTNFTANLLGLGNAATPSGLRAAKRMASLPGCENELCRLVIMNSASLQLIPTTVAAIRGSLGAAQSFDILPCVWLTSAAALAVGLSSARIMEGKKA